MLARVKIKMGQDEIEIDSRDFYVDNDTIHEVIGQMTRCMQKQDAKSGFKNNLAQGPQVREESLCNEMSCALPAVPVLDPQAPGYLNSTGLGNIREAEAFEPELSGDSAGSLDKDDADTTCGDTIIANDTTTNADDVPTDADERSHHHHHHGVLSHSQVLEGLLSLRDADAFFDSPRTAGDTVSKFWEYGWHASSLEVAKALAEMTSRRQITKNTSQGAPSTYVSPECCTDMDYCSKQEEEEESLFPSATAV